MHNYAFNGRIRKKEPAPSILELVKLPHERTAFIYQRLSSHEQLKKSVYSIAMQDALVEMAKEDGYPENLIHVEKRDLGISGTLGPEKREGLAYLIELIELDAVESVYIVHISRLFRDQTLIDGFTFGELCKEHGVILVMPNMRLNLRDKMHMRLYRIELERAADELELMKNRLLAARDMKARQGYYAGGSIPPGFILDADETIRVNGLEVPNPNYQKYKIWEPHARVVKAIFDLLSQPGMTPARVVKYCRKYGIVFPPFPPETAKVKANLLAFANSKQNSDGSCPVTRDRIRSITTNPAYIGWWIYQGEVLKTDNHPRIIDDETFWMVQSHYSHRSCIPKKDNPPPPLAGLLHCGKHEPPQRATYMIADSNESYYACRDVNEARGCWYITTYILDDPVSELVISQCSFQNLADKVAEQLNAEYSKAREKADFFEREYARLSKEIENLEANFFMAQLTPERIAWIEEKIKEKMEQRASLAKIENQHIGKVIGFQGISERDRDLITNYLANLKDNWSQQPSDLKNAFLSLILDRVMVYPNRNTIKAKLFWKMGLEQEILIHRPFTNGQKRWTREEEEILKAHYADMPQEELTELLPGRTWEAIRYRARKCLGLSRKEMTGTRGWANKRNTWKRWSAEEDEIVRKFYAGEIGKQEMLELVGRNYATIKVRACKLGLKRNATITWELISSNEVTERESLSAAGHIGLHSRPGGRRAGCARRGPW